MVQYGMVWCGMVWCGVEGSEAERSSYGESARRDGDKIEGGATIIATASITSNKYKIPIQIQIQNRVWRQLVQPLPAQQANIHQRFDTGCVTRR